MKPLGISLFHCMCLQEGLRILQEDGLVFKCYECLHDTVWNSELGSSVAIFQAGYTIDSLMLKYQGADWTDSENWNCNAGWVILVCCVVCMCPLFCLKESCNYAEAYAPVATLVPAKQHTL